VIGSTVDKYEVLQKVGEGGMATVYRGRHTTLDRDVAIKVLHPHLSSSTRNRTRFAREARAIEHLRHRNILEIFDYSGIDSGDCYIITEFVEGQTLSALVEQRGHLPSEVVARLGIELCAALSFAHDAGILHRDLKPDNVMVRADGTVKLMDFGIARFLDESQVTLTGALVGSPAFMSPEQAVEGVLDRRSDLFSLGTMLFYLVSGQLPFTGSNPSLILKNVIEGNRPNVAEIMPAISPALADAIERLMATDPSARFDHAAATAEALQGALREVELDVDDGSGPFSIAAYVRDPVACENRLAEHVHDVLLRVGKARLAAGDHLGALRLFNRLLALDEHHVEVLGLLQSLHAEPAPPSSARRRALPAVLVVVAGSVVAAVALALLLRPLEDRPVRPGPAAPVPTASAVVEPDPQPLSAIPAQPVPMPAVPAPEPTPIAAPSEPQAAEPVARPSPRPSALPERTPTPAPVATVPTASGPGRLRVVSNIPADVFHEGRRLGNTRSPIELEPGSYRLEVRSDVVLPYELRVEIAPDEVVERTITVQARPAEVRFAAIVADDCRVTLDGAELGTVGALDRRVEVQRPDQVGHELLVTCSGDGGFRKRWNDGVLPGEVVGP
jgi:tRNA A-37 threonylcarbamoyl transferase component Bud32